VVNIEEVEKRLGINFKNKELFTQALMHRSFVVENNLGDLASNERLEFLGDAVLELVVSEYLFAKFPTDPEGMLTQWRSIIVNTKTLADVCRELDLADKIFLSRGEKLSGGFTKERILTNVLEAIMGAIYLDGGYEKASDFIIRHILPSAESLLSKAEFYNPKGILQERVQAQKRITPDYKILKEQGPDHQKVFRVGVFFEDKKITEGEGNSKKEAEEEAARNALKLME